MGKRVSKAQIDMRRDMVASLLARGMRQSEIVAQLGSEFRTNADGSVRHDAHNNPIPNPTYFVNANTGKPFDKGTISRDVKFLTQQWRAQAEVTTDDHRSRQFAEILEAKRVAWAQRDMTEVRQILALEIKLLGTAVPEKLEHRWDDAQLGKVDRLVGLFQGMRHREQSHGSGTPSRSLVAETTPN